MEFESQDLASPYERQCSGLINEKYLSRKGHFNHLNWEHESDCHTDNPSVIFDFYVTRKPRSKLLATSYCLPHNLRRIR